MIIDQERWQHIQKHASIPHRGVPKAVVVAIAHVIGDAEIQAAWPTWDSTGAPTRWTCWIVTKTALGYVRIDYERALYDQHAEREQPLTPLSQSAWARPLTAILGLRWGAAYEAHSEHDTYYPAETIAVTFSDGSTITIPQDGASVQIDDRKVLDRILSALRYGANF